MSEYDEAVSAAMESTEPTQDAASRLMDTAIKIARNAPAKQGKYVSGAKIYWPLIHELRAGLDELGIEWRKS